MAPSTSLSPIRSPKRVRIESVETARPALHLSPTEFTEWLSHTISNINECFYNEECDFSELRTICCQSTILHLDIYQSRHAFCEIITELGFICNISMYSTLTMVDVVFDMWMLVWKRALGHADDPNLLSDVLDDFASCLIRDEPASSMEEELQCLEIFSSKHVEAMLTEVVNGVSRRLVCDTSLRLISFAIVTTLPTSYLSQCNVKKLFVKAWQGCATDDAIDRVQWLRQLCASDEGRSALWDVYYDLLTSVNDGIRLPLTSPTVVLNYCDTLVKSGSSVSALSAVLHVSRCLLKFSKSGWRSGGMESELITWLMKWSSTNCDDADIINDTSYCGKIGSLTSLAEHKIAEQCCRTDADFPSVNRALQSIPIHSLAKRIIHKMTTMIINQWHNKQNSYDINIAPSSETKTILIEDGDDHDLLPSHIYTQILSRIRSGTGDDLE